MRYFATGYWPTGYWPEGYWPEDTGEVYRLYRGVGGIESVDFDTLLGSAYGTSITLTGLGHAASTRYTYVCRPALDDLETPDLSCSVEFVTDSESDWTGNRPVPVVHAEAEVRADGVIRVRWRYRKGEVTPDDVSIWYGTTPPTGTGAPDHTATYSADGYSYKDFTLTDATAYYFRLVARDGSVESEPLIIGPYLADSTAPDAPTLTAEATW